MAPAAWARVYRARDTKLGREVALKILPEAFASDADRLMRFEREARTLASLNHPHIAQVYEIEDSGSTRALVMELVAGEDLPKGRGIWSTRKAADRGRYRRGELWRGGRDSNVSRAPMR